MVIHNKKNNKSLLSRLNYLIIRSVTAVIGLLFVVTRAHAIENPLAARTLAELVEGIANIIAIIGAILSVIFIILSGAMFVFARGNEEKITKAKSMFTWTVVGTAVLMGAWAIANAVIELIQSLGGA